MSLIDSSVLPALEKRLPKIINARTHGIIDYSHAAFFLGLALVCRKSNPRAAWAALGTGTFVLVQSLLTNYPLGAKPVIPFGTHGKMDAGFASASWAVPRVLGFSGTAAARVFRMNSFVEAAVVGMTDFDSERAQRERS
jgi:hypothetical protein